MDDLSLLAAKSAALRLRIKEANVGRLAALGLGVGGAGLGGYGLYKALQTNPVPPEPEEDYLPPPTSMRQAAQRSVSKRLAGWLGNIAGRFHQTFGSSKQV